MPMKLETVQQHLKEWGELIITTSGGARFEIHLGDTEFDFERRTLTLKTPTAYYVIAGDDIDNITKHFGHKE